MDNDSGIKLFDVDKNDVVLPTIEKDATQESTELISEEIDGAILGDKVKTLIIPEDTDIAPYNYVFDFTNLQSINVVQKSSLKALISLYGDIQLYLYNDKNGLTAFGMGDKYSLERTIPLIKRFVFNDEIKIYKNFRVGEKLEEVVSKDITKMRLNL